MNIKMKLLVQQTLWHPKYDFMFIKYLDIL